MRSKELVGKRFGKLIVVSRFAENTKSGKAQWVCKCDCGNTTIVPTYRLTMGETQSCGCKKFESHNKKHGMKHTRIYSIWCGVKKRCNNPKCKNYNRYGGSGISICEEWNNNFMAFYEWSMKNGYKDSLTIDRIDSSKGYSPENCRWATRKEQNNNRRNNLKISYQGRTQTLKQWCDELNLKYELVRSRIKDSGMTFEEAICAGIPEEPNHYDPIDKKSVEAHGLKYKTVWMRINAYGWSEEKALTTPVHHSHSYHPKPLSRPDKNNTHPSRDGRDSKDKP